MNITEIAPDITRIEVTLPKTPLKATNSYFVKGRERDLLIDTGFNHPVSHQALAEALAHLKVDMERTDIFVTHLHSDHAGLSRAVAKSGTRVIMSAEDGRTVGQGPHADFWESFREFYHFTGLYAGGHVTSVRQHPGYAFAPPASDDIVFVPDGHVLEVGGRRLVSVHTPGHTRGHFCLYCPDDKTLFSGDHILGKITPNITLMSLDHDALGEFLGSLELVRRLDVRRVFPGHRHRVDDCRARIDELFQHHQRRLDEAMAIVGDGRLNTVDVARRMRWSLTYENWDEYPPAQKLFSAGEALAHLHHLELAGKLTREADADGILYFRKG